MGREYSGADCKASMLGKAEVAFTSIEYKVSQAKKKLYKLGNSKPSGSVRGNKSYDGKVSLYQSEFESLQRSLPAGKDLTDVLPFNIVIMYINSENIPVTDVIKGVEITTFSKARDNGDDEMVIDCEFIADDVKLNA